MSKQEQMIQELRNAVYKAREAGVEEDEVRGQVDEALIECKPAAVPHVGGGLKLKGARNG